MEKIISDCENIYLPRNWEEAFEKVTGSLKHGSRIYWYFDDDKKFADEEGINIKEDPPFSGLVIARPDIIMQSGSRELDYEDCVVVVDDYPTEKCYPETDWIALNRLLDNEDLVEIFSK